MLPDRVSNPGPLTYESGALPIALRGPATKDQFDPWQVVPRKLFTSYSCLLISTAFVVVSCVGCLGVSGV